MRAEGSMRSPIYAFSPGFGGAGRNGGILSPCKLLWPPSRAWVQLLPNAGKRKSSGAGLLKCLSAPLRVRVNYIIIVTSSFSKSSVFKMFSLHTKMESLRLQIPQNSRTFLNSFFFFSGQFL